VFLHQNIQVSKVTFHKIIVQDKFVNFEIKEKIDFKMFDFLSKTFNPSQFFIIDFKQE